MSLGLERLGLELGMIVTPGVRSERKSEARVNNRGGRACGPKQRRNQGNDQNSMLHSGDRPSCSYISQDILDPHAQTGALSAR